MSTGIDIPNDVIGLLAETVERGASLLAGGSRLAGPAAAQDEAAELAPDESAGTVGLGLSFADDTAVVVVLTTPLAEELCGGSSPDHVRSGLQVLIDEITTGLGVPLADSVGLANTPALVAFLTGRPSPSPNLRSNRATRRPQHRPPLRQPPRRPPRTGPPRAPPPDLPCHRTSSPAASRCSPT